MGRFGVLMILQAVKGSEIVWPPTSFVLIVILRVDMSGKFAVESGSNERWSHSSMNLIA